MLPDAPAFTPHSPARRTLAEVVAEFAHLKAHIDQTDRDLAAYWQHLLTVSQYNAQIAADRNHFQAVRDALRSRLARMWEQALWVSARPEPSPQEPPPSPEGQAQRPSEGLRGSRLSSEAASPSLSFDWRLPRERPGLN